MTAATLLAITRPEDLFAGDHAAAKRVYYALSRRWHPDVVGGNANVFAHISDLYRSALDKLGRGVWEGAATLTFTSSTGKEILLPIRASAPFELGQSLVGDDYASWIVASQHAALVASSNWTGRFRYASDHMRQECARYLPSTWEVESLSDMRWCVKTRKTPDLLRLRDVVTHLGGLEPRHTAWVVSSLLNLACYLSYTGIVHHDISPDTYFISPEFHSGALLSGWWYAAERGATVTVVPTRTHGLMPFRARVSKRASTATDLECIRAIGRECGKVPVPMQTWLHAVGTGSAVEQYQQWQDVLRHTFGPRRFAVLQVDADEVYACKGNNGK